MTAEPFPWARERDHFVDKFAATMAEAMARTLMTMPGEGWSSGQAMHAVSRFWHGVVDDAMDDALQRLEREP